MKILFLLPYPLGMSPSQRFRFEQYLRLLREEGHDLWIQSFLNEDGWRVIYSKGNTLKKLGAIISGMGRRMAILPSAARADCVFIHREATPIGPPFFEWIIAKVLGKKIIYDFDDAIWMTDREGENFFARAVRWRRKVRSIIRWSHKISCGNEFLCDYARTFNRNVVLNPTTIDTSYHRPQHAKQGDEVVIGWTGSHTTLKYLDEIVPVIQSLEKKYSQLKFLVVANKKPTLSIQSLEFAPWNEHTEIEDLSRIDIGIMPLTDDDWSRGKCGFKALQYMAMEIPAVISPVGVNKVIVTNGVDGFICSNQSEWTEVLERLVNDATLRKKVGRAGREKVMRSYSVLSNSSTFLSLFDRSAIITSPTR
jgi:glycosyltransferase involved in cell wall biosynthesis